MAVNLEIAQADNSEVQNINMIGISGNTIAAIRASEFNFAAVAERAAAGESLTLRGEFGFSAAFFLAFAIISGRTTKADLEELGINLTNEDYLTSLNEQGCETPPAAYEIFGVTGLAETFEDFHIA